MKFLPFRGLITLSLSCLLFLTPINCLSASAGGLNVFPVSNSSAYATSGGMKQYKISGVLAGAQFAGFKARLAATNINTVEELFRHSNLLFKRADLKGKITLNVPSSDAPKQLVLWEHSEHTVPTAFLEQTYFERLVQTDIEFEPTDLTVNCHIYDNEKHEDICNVDNLSLLSLENPSPLLVKFPKEGATINDIDGIKDQLPTLIDVCEDVLSDNKVNTKDISQTCKEELEIFLNESSGMWLYNFSSAEVDNTLASAQHYYRVTGDVDWINYSENYIEPYGQIYLLPNSKLLKISEELEFQIPFFNALLPDSTRDPADTALLWKTTFNNLPDNRTRGLDPDNPNSNIHFDVYVQSDKDSLTKKDLKLFTNVWEKDKGTNGNDNCNTRGKHFGLEDLTSYGDGDGFAECHTNFNARLSLVSDKLTITPITPVAGEDLWELDGYMYFHRGDGSDDDIEPKGYLYVDIPSTGSTHADRLIWHDEYSNPINDFPNTNLPGGSKHFKFPFKIRFHAPESSLIDQKLLLHGDLDEKDGTGNDNYFDTDNDCPGIGCVEKTEHGPNGSLDNENYAYPISINSAMQNNGTGDIELPRNAGSKKQQHLFVNFKLHKLSEADDSQ